MNYRPFVWAAALMWLLWLLAGLARACPPDDGSQVYACNYPTLQAAVDRALSSDRTLKLLNLTYKTGEVIIDYSRQATTGFQIVSDGAIIDATASGQRALTIQCSGACFYLHLQGTLFVNANTTAAAVRIGGNDYADAHNSLKIDHLIVNNAGPGYGLRLNYVLNADIYAVAVTAGSAGLVLDQVQFSRIAGAASATEGIALLITRGYSFANTLSGLDLEVAHVCLGIDSPYANRNTFVSPYFNCPVPISATAGDRNMLLNASYGASQPPAVQPHGIVSIP